MTDIGKNPKRLSLLPENAYTKLKPGEEYVPIVSPDDKRPEVTKWSLSTGLVMVAIFAAACIYITLRTGNGIEASIKLGTYRPDLLILDIFMPEMDGLEVCRIISNEPELADISVIITTGYPQHPKLDEVVALGYTNIFSKPFDLLNFIEAIDKILRDG